MSEPLVSVGDFEKNAAKVLSKNDCEFFRSGAGNELTLTNNRRAFSKYKIRPRCLRNVSERTLSTTVLGKEVGMPIGISPSALQKMAHPDGESASARAASSMGAIFILSAFASSSIEEVAKKSPDGTKWLQLFIFKDRDLTKDLVRRAEQAGFEALVLTIDCPVLGSRKFTLPQHIKFSNFGEKQDYIAKNVRNIIDPTLKWDDVKWLQSITKLPVIPKGILTAEDAVIAADLGLRAVMVSNHGGRQLDGLPATIEVLPEIIKAVRSRIEVYVDGGITDGTDIYKALALGAKMAFVGRSPIWGLVHSGEAGVRKILDILRTELDYALAITGCSSVQDIDSNMVVHESYYNKL